MTFNISNRIFDPAATRAAAQIVAQTKLRSAHHKR
jgi:hypothetical protein